MAVELSIEQIVPEEVAEPVHLRLVPELVRLVPEMDGDYELRLQAARLAGQAVVSQEVSLEEVETARPITSLFDALQRAHYDNDPIALNMIGANAGTNMVEMTVKAGTARDIELEVDDDQKILQWNHSLESVQANSARRIADGSPQMQARVAAEGNNVIRLQHHLSRGELEDNYYVVISRAPDDMPVEQADKEGFFVDAMSISIQATTLKGGNLVTEPAFVAGLAEPGAERHDAKMIAGLGDQLGVDLSHLTSTELLDTPLLISKRLMPNGVIDVVETCDEVTGTFFGQNKPKQDYVEFRQQAFDREDMLAAKKQAIVAELVSEAPSIRDELHATERMHKITEKHMVQQAMFDRAIDPSVFGTAAAPHISEGRLAFEQGRYEEGLRHTQKAERLSDARGCPSGMLKGSGEDSQGGKEGGDKSDEPGDCDFISKECPMCHKKNVRTVISNGMIKGDCGCKAKLK